MAAHLVGCDACIAALTLLHRRLGAGGGGRHAGPGRRPAARPRGARGRRARAGAGGGAAACRRAARARVLLHRVRERLRLPVLVPGGAGRRRTVDGRRCKPARIDQAGQRRAQPRRRARCRQAARHRGRGHGAQPAEHAVGSRGDGSPRYRRRSCRGRARLVRGPHSMGATRDGWNGRRSSNLRCRQLIRASAEVRGGEAAVGPLAAVLLLAALALRAAPLRRPRSRWPAVRRSCAPCAPGGVDTYHLTIPRRGDRGAAGHRAVDGARQGAPAAERPGRRPIASTPAAADHRHSPVTAG